MSQFLEIEGRAGGWGGIAAIREKKEQHVADGGS